MKPEHPEETHTDAGRTGKLHKERTWNGLGFEPRTFSLLHPHPRSFSEHPPRPWEQDKRLDNEWMDGWIIPIDSSRPQFGLAPAIECAWCLHRLTCRNHVTGGPCPSKANIKGKTVVITGANTGIGKETARELAKRGGRVIMGCRDMGKCEEAAKEIRGKTLNPHVYACHLDLASMKSIREFAEQVKQKEQRVDILINNAGVMRCPAWKTEDGFDMQFGVNHLGHFLLTNLLLEKLRDSAPSRVINMASLAHVVGQIDFDDLNWEKRKFNTKQAYCQSKLANVMFTRELARRLEGTGVTVNAVHPGVVATELGRHTGLHQSQFSTSVLSPFFSLLVKGPELGAQPSVYLAVAEELEGTTGRYYDVMTEKEPAPQALDEEANQRLWEASARLVGLQEEGSEQAAEAAVPPGGQSETPRTNPAQTEGPSPEQRPENTAVDVVAL